MNYKQSGKNVQNKTKKKKTQEKKVIDKMRVKQLLTLFIALSVLLSFTCYALPSANKQPFYDFSTVASGWWSTTNTKSYTGHRGPWEYAFLIYTSNAVSITEIEIMFRCNDYTYNQYKTLAGNIILQSGFYIVYAYYIKTDTNHYAVFIYDCNGNKIAERNENDVTNAVSQGETNEFHVKLSVNDTIYISKVYFVKLLSDGDTQTFSPLFDALNYVQAKTTAIIRIESYTSPTNVRIYYPTANTTPFYEQGFTENEQTYVFIAQDKLPAKITANGPAGSKTINISSVGLWIVKLTSELTNIYLNETSASNETSTTNTNYTIRVEAYDYYNYSSLNATVFLNNSEIGRTFTTLYVSGHSGTLKVSKNGYYDFTANVVIKNTTYYVYLKPHITPNRYYYVEFQVFRKIEGTWQAWTVPIIVDNSIRTNSFEQIRLKQGVHKAYINSETGKCYQYYVTFNLQSNMTIPIYVDTADNVTIVVDKDANESEFTKNYIGEKPEIGNWIGFKLVNKRNSTVNVAIVMHYTKFTTDVSVTLTTFQMQSNSITYYTISVGDITDILLKADITNPFTGNDATNTYYDVVVDGTPIVEGIPYNAVKNNYFRVEISNNANVVYNANASSSGWLKGLSELGLIGALIVIVIVLKLLDKL